MGVGAGLTEEGRGCFLHEFLRLIGCQLSSTQQAGGGSLGVLQRVAERTGHEQRHEHEEEEVPAVT